MTLLSMFAVTVSNCCPGAEVEGMPGVAHGLFTRGGAELVFYFYADCNRRLADQLAAEVKAQRQAEGEGAQKPGEQLVETLLN